MEEKKNVDFEVLKRFGSKWAVLAAMQISMNQKGARAASEQVESKLEQARIKIRSGCYSVCDVDCSLSEAEAVLVAAASQFGDDYVQQWMDLLGWAANGELDFERINQIPALKPIATDCTFLRCGCQV